MSDRARREVAKAVVNCIVDFGYCITPKVDGQVTQLLVDRYESSDRAYHTLDHLDHGLQYMKASNPTLRWAWLWHDYICDPKNPNSEEDSAFVAVEQFKRLFVDQKVPRTLEYALPKIHALVLATKHGEEKNLETHDERFIHDIDLVGFATLNQRVVGEQLRCEYYHLTDREWNIGRIRFAAGMLKRKRIFLTEEFTYYNTAARRHLWEILHHHVDQL